VRLSLPDCCLWPSTSLFLFVPNSWSSGDLGLKYLFWGLKRDTTYTIYRGWIVYCIICKNMAKYRYLSSTSTCRQKCLRRTVSSSSSSSSSSLLLLLLLSSSSSSDMAALRVSPFFLAALRNWYTEPTVNSLDYSVSVSLSVVVDHQGAVVELLLTFL
jgi:hypothetical protein